MNATSAISAWKIKLGQKSNREMKGIIDMKQKKHVVQLLYFSDLLSEKYPADSANLFAALKKHNVAYGFIKGAKDVNIRGFMPIPFSRCNIAFEYAPSRPNKSPESVTDFSRDIDTDWELVNGWRPPRSYQKSKIKLSGNDILIGNGVILSDRIFAANPRHGKSELMRELESTIMYRTDIIVIPSRKDDIAGQACNMVRFLNDRTVLFDESLSEGTLGEQLQNTIQYRGLHVLEFPSAPAEGNGAVGCYLNYLETDEALFLPVFGIDSDAKAIAAAEKIFSKPVEPVMIPNLAADGMGLYGISWGMSDCVR